MSPFDFGIINMKPGDQKCDDLSEKLYQSLINAGFDPLLDDTQERAGSKFATMDLIGLPTQIIIGPKNAAQNEVEIKDRKTGHKEILPFDAALRRLTEA